jgi:hypothetical protein
MQPSNEQLEQSPLRREKLLEYLSWLEHTLVPQRLTGGAKFFKRT